MLEEFPTFKSHDEVCDDTAENYRIVEGKICKIWFLVNAFFSYKGINSPKGKFVVADDVDYFF